MDFNRWLRYGILAGIFATPFIPLLVNSNFFFPFITFKNFTFRVLVELMLGAWIILALRDPAYRPKFSWLLAALAAFVGVIALADIFGVNFERSFWSNFERMEGLVTHLHLFAYFLIVSSVLSAGRLWERFFQTSIGASVIVCVYGIFQLLGVLKINQGGVRVDATFGNATYLAIYLLFHIFLTVFLLLRSREHPWLRWVYGAILFLQFAVLYHTASRGVILGLVGGTLITAILIALFDRNEPRLRKISAGVLIGFGVFAGLFLLVRSTSLVQDSPVLSRFASFSVLDEIKTRTIVWNMAWNGFKERPILGWGQENFNLVFNKNYDPRMYAKEQWFDRTHNVVLDWLIAGGVLGLLAYLSIFAALAYLLWFRGRSVFSFTERALFSGLFAGYLFQNLFIFDNITSYILFFSLLAYLHHSTNGRDDEGSLSSCPAFSSPLKAAPPLIRERIAPAAVAAVVIIGLYFLNVRPILASRAIIDGLRPQEAGLSRNLDYFKQALAYGTFGSPEIREQLTLAASRVGAAPASSVSLNVKQDFYDTAVAELNAQIERTPEDARYELFLGSLLHSFGKYSEALPHLERALELSPNKQSILTEIGSVYINMKQYAKALTVLKEAYELEPNFRDAARVYAVAAIYAGNNRLANDLLMASDGATVVADDRLIRAYIETRQYEKVVAVWKLKVAQEPQNPQHRLSLAASYLLTGERNRAIAEIEEIIKLRPEFKDQGEYYIREIRAGRNP